MNQLLTILGLMLMVTAGAQEWNPDSNSDGIIGVTDLNGLLSVFGMEWDDDLQIQIIDTLMDAEGQIQFEILYTWGSNGVSGYNYVELLIADTSDVIIFNDFHCTQDVLFDGLIDGIDYSTGAPYVRVMLPSPDTQKCLILLFDDAYNFGEEEWKFQFYEGETRVSEIDPADRMMVRACAVGGKWFFNRNEL